MRKTWVLVPLLVVVTVVFVPLTAGATEGVAINLPDWAYSGSAVTVELLAPMKQACHVATSPSWSEMPKTKTCPASFSVVAPSVKKMTKFSVTVTGKSNKGQKESLTVSFTVDPLPPKATVGSPVITTQPSDLIEPALTGTVSATASSATPETVQWYYLSTVEGWTPIKGATKDVLTPTSAGAGDYTEYQARFTNKKGTTSSNVARVALVTPDPHWTGYASAASENASSVTGTWNVPAVDCSSGASSVLYSWVGVNSGNVLPQTGMGSSCSAGVAQYSFWYTVCMPGYCVPAYPPGNYPVEPGDAVTASVSVGASIAGEAPVAAFVVTDVTQDWTFTTSEQAPGFTDVGAIASWIVEDADNTTMTGAMSPFSPVTFTNLSYTPTTNGVAYTQPPIVGSYELNPYATTVTPYKNPPYTVLAMPSLITSSGDFTVTYFQGLPSS